MNSLSKMLFCECKKVSGKVLVNEISRIFERIDFNDTVYLSSFAFTDEPLK